MELNEALDTLNKAGFITEASEGYFTFSGIFQYESDDGPIEFDDEKDKMEYYMQEAMDNAWKYVKVKIVEWRDNQNMKIQFKVPKYDYVKEDVSEIKKYIFDELAYDMDYYGDGLECRSI